jgi:hypothetical protein
VGQVDEESRNAKAVELKENLADSYQVAFTLSRNVVKSEIVDVSGMSSIKPTAINGIYHPQPSSSPRPGLLSTLLEARIQADTSATYPIATCRSKQEPIEEPIHTAVTIQPRNTLGASSLQPPPQPHRRCQFLLDLIKRLTMASLAMVAIQLQVVQAIPDVLPVGLLIRGRLYPLRYIILFL